jgi:CheY-like chemotaxis protein/anti-sigma regulatory factor (Ser/Thr protein kinase)
MAEHNPLQRNPRNVFSHQLHTGQPSYETIAHVRRRLVSLCQREHLSSQDTDAVALTFSEIVTNLIKHPRQKARNIFVTLSATDKMIELDVADDSTPFDTFTERCAVARARPSAAESLREGGYGLHCILSLQTETSYVPMTKSADRLNHFIARRGKTRMDAYKPFFPDHRQKPLIFLVDDDNFSLQYNQTALEDEFEIVSFSSAAEALAAFPGLKPEIIVSDFYMPGMNGADLRMSLSKSQEGNLTPFVFLSGGDEKNMSYLSSLGIDDFLQKPTPPQRLKTVLHRLLHRSRQIKKIQTTDFNSKISSVFQPRLPKSHGEWSFALRHAERDAGGGDFLLYHFASTGINILLADVMGHGVEAKFFSYAYAGYLRGLFRMYGHAYSPSEVLSAMSRTVVDDALLESTLVTCLGLHIGLDGWVKIASAGHPPPLLSKSGTIQKIDVRGPLPGLMSQAKYEDTRIRMNPGDSLIIGTDGFFDAMPETPPETNTSTADALADRLWQLTEATPHPSPDDRTLAVLRFGGNHVA